MLSFQPPLALVVKSGWAVQVHQAWGTTGNKNQVPYQPGACLHIILPCRQGWMIEEVWKLEEEFMFSLFISKNSLPENWNICDLIFGSCFYDPSGAVLDRTVFWSDFLLPARASPRPCFRPLLHATVPCPLMFPAGVGKPKSEIPVLGGITSAAPLYVISFGSYPSEWRSIIQFTPEEMDSQEGKRFVPTSPTS